MTEKDRNTTEEPEEKETYPANQEDETTELGREEVRQIRDLADKARDKAADKLKSRSSE